MTTKYAYSDNEEIYQGEFDSREDAISEISAFLDAGESPVKYWIGEQVPFSASQFLPDIDDIVDHMLNASADGTPEIAETYLEDYFFNTDKLTKAKMSFELHETITKIFKDNGIDIDPKFFGIKDAKAVFISSEGDVTDQVVEQAA